MCYNETREVWVCEIAFWRRRQRVANGAVHVRRRRGARGQGHVAVAVAAITIGERVGEEVEQQDRCDGYDAHSGNHGSSDFVL